MKDWITENFYFAELTVFDTCGSITGTLKAAMKALVGADTSCLQPPYYLGSNSFNNSFQGFFTFFLKKFLFKLSNSGYL